MKSITPVASRRMRLKSSLACPDPPLPALVPTADEAPTPYPCWSSSARAGSAYHETA